MVFFVFCVSKVLHFACHFFAVCVSSNTLIIAVITAFNLKVHVIVLQTTNGKVQIPMAKKEEGLNDFLCSLNNATYGRLQNQINALIK